MYSFVSLFSKSQLTTDISEKFGILLTAPEADQKSLIRTLLRWDKPFCLCIKT